MLSKITSLLLFRDVGICDNGDRDRLLVLLLLLLGLEIFVER